MCVVYVWFKNDWRVHHVYPTAMAARVASKRLERRGRLSYVSSLS